jgi:hypothetical protein
MEDLRLYAVFHLNLAYSSIEEKQRSQVIRDCYWPLLTLAQETQWPVGIEATGYTLETIASLDPAWIERLRLLTRGGLCEFIGSGYSQIIGPLVPAEVNAANLRLGRYSYERLLRLQPLIALVNEQAYSPGLIQHYLDVGYHAMIMEWDNPFHVHPEWDPSWHYLPQRARGQKGEEIPLVWSKSIAFQKFQRYAQGEMELEEYIQYLASHIGRRLRAFPLYTNDAEVFDFRPGRYAGELPLTKTKEWLRIRSLIESLQKDKRFRFIQPSQVLELLGETGAGNSLSLESAEQPIPVKKQGKYNITRWAVTGPDDLRINTACWRIYEGLKAHPGAGDEDWRELCYLWGSDFRTHITGNRWKKYCQSLGDFERKAAQWARRLEGRGRPRSSRPPLGDPPFLQREGRYLTIESKSWRLRLNCRRGLAIDGVWFDSLEGPPIFGTLPHGYFDDIDMGSDWYSGHSVLEVPGSPKITDLELVEPTIKISKVSGEATVRGVIETPLGQVTKIITIGLPGPVLSMVYRFNWKKIPAGSFRLGNITLHPEAFDVSTLWLASANGGKYLESFSLKGCRIEHGAPVSFLVSARNGLGLTDGRVDVGDAQRVLRLEVEKASAAVIGLISYREVVGSYFFRLALSVGEMDETRALSYGQREIECRFRVSLRKQSNSQISAGGLP